MYLDFITLLIIIVLSYVFSLSITKKYDSQAMFILLTCLVLIIYKCLINKYMSENFINEGFENVSTELLQFVQGEMPNNLQTEDVMEYKRKLSQLVNKIETMNQNLEEIKKANEITNEMSDGSMESKLELSSKQQIQDDRIKRMQEQVDMTNDLLRQAQMKEESAKFKKIPIYSSCVVSNADGTLTTETVRNNSNPSNEQNVDGVSSLNNVAEVSDIGSVNPNVNQRVEGNNQLSEVLKSLFEGNKNINVNLKSS